jgi:CPA1 family monovalent cation:H+ antiporter
MRLFELIAVLTVLTAGFGYVNVRLLKLPSTIGLMALSLAFATTLVVIGSFVPAVEHQARAVAQQFDLDQALLHGMLGFLLFAGALHIDLGDLKDHQWPIAVLASLGVLISTAIVGGLTWVVLGLVGLPLRLIDGLLFGALISPTDPIAVLALLKQTGAPKQLEVQIAGESLFNDGVGVVVFLGLLDIATGREEPRAEYFLSLFARGGRRGQLRTRRRPAGVPAAQVGRPSLAGDPPVARPGRRRLRPGRGPETLCSDRHGRGRVADRQSRPELCHVGDDDRAPRPFLGAAR